MTLALKLSKEKKLMLKKSLFIYSSVSFQQVHFLYVIQY
jgi:hypothetical protein